MFWEKGSGPMKHGISEATVTNVLHTIELGAWAKYIKMFLFLLAVFVLLLIYQSNQFRGLEIAEAMDNAQLARNIFKGEGFTTKFIRPASAWRLKEVTEDHDPRLKAPHPDLINPPLFPYTLAAAFKLRTPSFEIKPIANQPYTKYPPETLIIAVCEFFFIASGALLYVLARQLFDKRIAFISLLLFLLSDLMWRYSISGLPTTMLLFLFLCAQVCMVNGKLLVDKEGNQFLIWGLAAATGLFCGLALLTKYSAGWLLLPVLGYVVLTYGKHRYISFALVLVLFVGVITPWILRNDSLSGKWFGMAAYASIEQTDRYPNDKLQRSFEHIEELRAKQVQKKFLLNMRTFAEGGWLKTGAGIASIFFLASLLYRYKRTEVLSYRRFLVCAALLAAIVGAFGSTISNTADFPANPQNLVVLLGPGIILMSVAFFFLLFDRIDIQIALLKHAAVALFVVICASSLIFSLLPPRRNVVRYPAAPYYEPVLSVVSKWIGPDEMMMTDMPWAVAWYGNRKALWLPNTMEQFYQINDYHQRVAGLLLTPLTLDRNFLSDMLRPNAELRPWVTLFLGQMPQGFPLVARTSIPGFDPDLLFFSDRARWNEEPK